MIFKVKKSQTICICMIVKNESHVIERCIRSFYPVADYFIICDTGSTDGTIEKIKNVAKSLDLPGEVLEHPWKNFAHNRSLSLKSGRSKADYLLVIDADEVLKYKVGNEYLEIDDIHVEPNIIIPALEKDCYNILSNLGSITYDRLQLMNTKLDWRYESVVHEYAISDNITSIGKIQEFMNMPRVEGARSKDPNKYLKDALVLEKGLLDEPQNSRYYFYLAQSYRDAGIFDKSRENYVKRLKMDGYEEEQVVCYHQIGYCCKMLGETIDDYGRYYLEGYHKFPHRLECFYEFIRDQRIAGRPQLAYSLGYSGAHIGYPYNDHLFILKDIYTHLFKLELALCCIELKKFEEGIVYLKFILDKNSFDIPLDKRQEIEVLIKNITCILGKGVDNLQQIEITYDENELKNSKMSIKIMKYKVFLHGSKKITNDYVREILKIDPTIRVEKSSENTVPIYDQDTLYIYTTKKENPSWNELFIENQQKFDLFKVLLHLDKASISKYLQTYVNDFRFASCYKNICSGDPDIVLLGEPSIQKLRNIIRIMTINNRIFILNWDNPNRIPESSAILDTVRHLSVGNIGNSHLKDNLGLLLESINIKDAKIGWIDITDIRLSCLLPVELKKNMKIL